MGVVALVSLPQLAVAEPLPPPRMPVVSAPRVKGDAGVLFPEQALHDQFTEPVTADLVLEVDAEGHVVTARVATLTSPSTLENPHGHGFEAAALATAEKLVFEPATRDGRKVAARINFRYLFTPPLAKLSGQARWLSDDSPLSSGLVTVRDAKQKEHTTQTKPDGTWSIGSLPPGPVHISIAAPGASLAQTDEVLAPNQATDVVLRLKPAPRATPAAADETVIFVKGERPPREVSRRSLGRDEIRHSAGTQGDALLAIQNLPGIARPPPFSGALVVRGSGPDDSLVLIDGTEVPLAYHFGGLSSVVPTELVDQIDFYPGNFSARYGRAMGGIVETRLRPPRPDGYHVVIENSLLGFRGIVEGSLGHGYRFFAAGQRSWLDLVFTPILKLQGEAQTALPIWADYQLAIQKDFSAQTSARLLFFGSDDALDIVEPVANATDPVVAGALGYHTSFWRVQAAMDSQLTSRTHVKLTAAYGRDRLALALGNNSIDATLHPLSTRVELSEQWAPGVRANLGAGSVGAG